MTRGAKEISRGRVRKRVRTYTQKNWLAGAKQPASNGGQRALEVVRAARTVGVRALTGGAALSETLVQPVRRGSLATNVNPLAAQRLSMTRGGGGSQAAGSRDSVAIGRREC
jgi:hypothetical protein